MKYSHWNGECQLKWKLLAANRLSTQKREKKEILFGISTFYVMEFEVISFDAQRNKSAKRPNFFPSQCIAMPPFLCERFLSLVFAPFSTTHFCFDSVINWHRLFYIMYDQIDTHRIFVCGLFHPVNRWNSACLAFTITKSAKAILIIKKLQ